MSSESISPYQEQVIAYLQREGKGSYGFANLRSLIAMKKKGLIVYKNGVWELNKKNA